MKQFVLIIVVLFVVAVIIVINLPPKAITLDEISRSDAPRSNIEEHDTLTATPVKNPVTISHGEAVVDYYIIVQSFRKLEQAQEKARKLKKVFSADFIVLPPTPEGYYRVSCGKYSTMEEARSKIKSITNRMGSQVWILPVKR
jgi:hypothetical protein